jgi:hypothetical protein
MKTVITVLNENPGSRSHWPASGTLRQMRAVGSWAHCCLGAHGLVYGVAPDRMVGLGTPACVLGAPLGWREAWGLIVPDDVRAAITTQLGEREWCNDYGVATSLAVAINDTVAAPGDAGAREAAVAALRILFSWVGHQVGERWVIRHIRRRD